MTEVARCCRQLPEILVSEPQMVPLIDEHEQGVGSSPNRGWSRGRSQATVATQQECVAFFRVMVFVGEYDGIHNARRVVLASWKRDQGKVQVNQVLLSVKTWPAGECGVDPRTC